MPNHITNILAVSGKPTELKRFRKAVESTAVVDKARQFWLDFNGTVPMPESIKGTTSPPQTEADKKLQAENLAKHGAGNWYDWSIKNYGTKWGAYDCEVPDVGRGKVTYRFNTAWSPPAVWLGTTAKLYPGLLFEDCWIDEGGGAGRITIHADKGVFEDESVSDHEWRIENDSNYKEEYEFITEGDYDEVVEIFQKNEELNYYDLERFFVARLKNKDLPLFVSREWLTDSAHKAFTARVKKGKNG